MPPSYRESSRGSGTQPSRQGLYFYFQVCPRLSGAKSSNRSRIDSALSQAVWYYAVCLDWSSFQALGSAVYYLSKFSRISFPGHISLSMSFFSNIRWTCKITYFIQLYTYQQPCQIASRNLSTIREVFFLSGLGKTKKYAEVRLLTP